MAAEHAEADEEHTLEQCTADPLTQPLAQPHAEHCRDQRQQRRAQFATAESARATNSRAASARVETVNDKPSACTSSSLLKSRALADKALPE